MPRISEYKPAFGLAAWLALVTAAAFSGTVAAPDSAQFYKLLARPPWAPPGWLFGPVWTLLYLLMGISAWLVWRKGGFRASRAALALFLAQLALNSLWTWVFFAWRQGALAFAEVLVLWALILATVVAFWRRTRAAGLLLLPYLAWVSFAAVLAFAIWQLNPLALA